MILICEFYVGDEFTYSATDYIPFEYESKDKFVFDVLEAAKNFRFDLAPFELPILDGCYNLKKQDAENIERNVYTVEEWIAREKKEVVIPKEPIIWFHDIFSSIMPLKEQNSLLVWHIHNSIIRKQFAKLRLIIKSEETKKLDMSLLVTIFEMIEKLTGFSDERALIKKLINKKS